ncbi:MAG: hypothetical protein JJE27_04585, partial [Thermoleophilia bacterium]|nr:hypothetical protein [Thermoleophilia bacterium]
MRMININHAPPVQSQPLAEPGHATAYDHFRVQGVGWDFYNRVCRRVGFPRSIAPELLGHFAGFFDGGWEVIDLWRDGEAMERVFSRHLVDSISSVIAETVPRPDVEPELRAIARLVVGPGTANYHEADPESTAESLALRGLEPLGVVTEFLGDSEPEYLEACARL